MASGRPADVLTADLVREVYGVEAVVDATDQGPMVRFLPLSVQW